MNYLVEAIQSNGKIDKLPAACTLINLLVTTMNAADSLFAISSITLGAKASGDHTASVNVLGTRPLGYPFFDCTLDTAQEYFYQFAIMHQQCVSMQAVEMNNLVALLLVGHGTIKPLSTNQQYGLLTEDTAPLSFTPATSMAQILNNIVTVTEYHTKSQEIARWSKTIPFILMFLDVINSLFVAHSLSRLLMFALHGLLTGASWRFKKATKCSTFLRLLYFTDLSAMKNPQTITKITTNRFTRRLTTLAIYIQIGVIACFPVDTALESVEWGNLTFGPVYVGNKRDYPPGGL
ncbi:hypothetical protein T265_02776 [Opisthorchis viverrini]|uniref:Uncharacterized protein n=1 Tax=Opisthorchis viverrini TaxID=6198 RepID=A0A075AI14_OPIVI|nr:hypothetical protein T265_02776 [Opisthorchis viverrini]KER30839.1 hypothetical protein T265_02776 [Opisthorchis viverrini]